MPFAQRIIRISLLLGALAVFAGEAPTGRYSVLAQPVQPIPISHNLSDYAVSNLNDLETTMKAIFHDDDAAHKISKDANLIYQLKGNVLVRYKAENNFRADGLVNGYRATVVINGARQTYRMALGVKMTVDVTKAPGKRTSLLDLGLISDYYLTYAQGEFQGERVFEGVPCAVFKLTFKDHSRDTSHRLVWIDPRTHVTLKREEYLQEAQGGKLRDVWLYREPKEVAPGVFFPSRIELYNDESEKAGETEYTGTRVNIGLADDVFRR
jgi:hypothetical protein